MTHQLPPPPPIRMKPEFVEGDTCDWCWKWLTPGFLFRPNKVKEIQVLGKGRLVFCDSECQDNYVREGCSLYELGARDACGEYSVNATRESVAPSDGSGLPS